jgi:tRNA1Val (adenine37-N6)-methyltransferase
MSVFRFKQFTIKQDKVAMKVGTDSILLGSWLKLSNKPSTILDVGTGSGLLALMMAQKHPSSSITAIEIDAAAYNQAEQNIKESLWGNRINTVHVDAKVWNPKEKFDLIISNPPYFSNSLLANTKSRTQARHQKGFTLNDLCELWQRLGSETSQLACILPVDEAEILIKLIQDIGFYLEDYTAIFSKVNTKPNRAIMLFAKEKAPTTMSELYIRNEKGSYSKDFIELTKDFYLELR